MKESYIQLYDRNEKSIKIFMALSGLLFAIGAIGLIFYFSRWNLPLFELSLWQNGFLTIQGIAMFFILHSSLKFKRFFISWNNYEISYHFPKNKHPEKFKIDEIKSLKINGAEIKILLCTNETKTINLNYVFMPKRMFVKEYFQSLEVGRIVPTYPISE
jgi:hypothetical protein